MSTSHTQPTSSYAFSLGRKWSPSEKAVAHKAFDKALENELQAVIIEVKTRASKIEEPEELWELEDYLMKRRKEINRLYDYRYSVLTEVFG